MTGKDSYNGEGGATIVELPRGDCGLRGDRVRGVAETVGGVWEAGGAGSGQQAAEHGDPRHHRGAQLGEEEVAATNAEGCTG